MPQRTVDPSEEDLARIRKDSKLVREARKNMFFEPFFLQGFSKPIEGPKKRVFMVVNDFITELRGVLILELIMLRVRDHRCLHLHLEL